MKQIIITPGEPAGIGPDIVLLLANSKPDLELNIIADQDLMAERSKQLGIPFPKRLNIIHIPLTASCQAGIVNPANSHYVLECLTQATEYCLSGTYHGLVTGPVHKASINQAGIRFSGHTEFLAKLTGQELPVMLFVAGTIKLALLTTHLPLSQVPSAITFQKIIKTIEIIHQDLPKWFGIKAPRIAVCGLNPHAGENGYIGREEIEIITPALNQLRQQGMIIQGPLPADTSFTPTAQAKYDVILTMYHDQGLPVIKSQFFDSAVNVTLGLPIIRTSVDHGTALELAGTGRVEFSNLLAAIKLASQMAST